MADAAAPVVLGFYPDARALVAACRQARAAGHERIEAVSPYPVHGIDPVIGIPRSWIGRPVLLTALLGFVAAYGFLYHTSVIEWPIQVSGKPFHWWVGFVVPTLELGLLGAAIVNLLACFHATKSMPLPVTTVASDRLTDDEFAIAIPVRAGFTADSLAAWLRDRGATRTSVWAPPAAGQADAGEPAHA